MSKPTALPLVAAHQQLGAATLRADLQPLAEPPPGALALAAEGHRGGLRDLPGVDRVAPDATREHRAPHRALGGPKNTMRWPSTWWLCAANGPSGVIALAGDKRRKPGFEVHADVRVRRGDKTGRQQLIRYVTRPPFAEAQLQILDEERVRFELRSPLKSGQEQIILHPLALMPRLAWLIPPPRQHQIRYAGVLAPAAFLRPAIVPAGRISVQGALFPTNRRAFEPLTPEPYRVAWAQLLSQTCDVDGQACPACPGTLKPVGAVLPPHASTWLKDGRVYPLGAMAPPPVQLSLPLREAS